jgi:site-specific DNA-methyltransferase (adenine-specific)
MKIEFRKPAAIKPYPGNPRVNDQAVDAVAASIREFGFRQPIVVDATGIIICGHTRWKAAAQLGLAKVPVHVAKELTPAQIKAYRIADNQTATLADWEKSLLEKELKDLAKLEFDLSLLAFDPEELGRLLASADGSAAAQRDPDDTPAPPAKPLTRPGDLWLLGEHRLLCGDARRPEDIDRVMQGDRAICVFTDPPYGVSIGKKNRDLNRQKKSDDLNRQKKSGRCLEDIAGDDLSPDELEKELLAAFVVLRERAMADDCTLCVCSPQGGGLGMMMMMMMMQKAGLAARHILIWVKNSPTFSMGRLDYDYQHEPILLSWTKRHRRPMKGEHRTSVWQIDRPRASPDHPTTKPAALYVNAYQNHSDPGDIVADIYAGSGTAFVAAEQIGRKARGVELSPTYCDVAVRRWEEFTGRKVSRAPSEPKPKPRKRASHCTR